MTMAKADRKSGIDQKGTPLCRDAVGLGKGKVMLSVAEDGSSSQELSKDPRSILYTLPS
jgi:hypothetical protein